MPNREPTNEPLPEPLPTPQELAETLQAYLDSEWSWRDLENKSGVNSRVLRKMLDWENNNYWYESAQKFWQFHVDQWALAAEAS